MAIVPCCVFPSLFPHAPARYADFCDYLMAKDPANMRLAFLGVEGKNKVIYRLPPPAEDDYS